MGFLLEKVRTHGVQPGTQIRPLGAWPRNASRLAFLGAVLFLAAGCRSSPELRGPSLVFLRVPPGEAGGPELLDHLSGRVLDAPPGARIVAYTRNKVWWVQPFRSRPFTEIRNDGSWTTATHLGTDYAVLLISPGYQPAARTTDLPPVGGNVLAVSVTKGSPGLLDSPKVIHFSGYDWTVSSSADIRGGELNNYEPSNAWVDDRG